MSIKERLGKLIDVKSLVTLALVGVLCVMTALGRETANTFDSAVMLVLGFFFGKNLRQNSDEATSDNKNDKQ